MLKLPTIFMVIAASILAVIHFISLELFLYWRYLWLDIPMHALGGAVAALGIFTLHDLWPGFPKRFLYPIPVLLFVLIAALLWEVLAVGVGVDVPAEERIEVDTAIDIIMGMLGAVVGYIVGYSVSTLDLDYDRYESR